MTSRFSRHLAAVVGGIGLAGLASGAVAQDVPVGQQLFAEACAVCHGTDGKGGGEFADQLKVAPPDLTKLVANNPGAVYHFVNVYHIIDGRSGVRAHGDGDMPIWGTVFARDAPGAGLDPLSAEVLVRGRMVALVEYIESVQE